MIKQIRAWVVETSELVDAKILSGLLVLGLYFTRWDLVQGAATKCYQASIMDCLVAGCVEQRTWFWMPASVSLGLALCYPLHTWLNSLPNDDMW